MPFIFDVSVIALLLSILTASVKGVKSLSDSASKNMDTIRTELTQNINLIREELNQFKTELKTEINQVETELKGDLEKSIRDMKEDFHTSLNEVKTNFTKQDDYILRWMKDQSRDITDLGYRLTDVEATLNLYTDGKFNRSEKFIKTKG